MASQSWTTVHKKKGREAASRKPEPSVDDTLVEQMELLRLFKTQDCKLGQACPDAKQCNYYHPWEESSLVKRRNPFSVAYQTELCDYADTAVQCPRGIKCPLAHTKFEVMYHPLIFKCQPCREGATCKRGKQCAFAHSDLEQES